MPENIESRTAHGPDGCEDGRPLRRRQAIVSSLVSGAWLAFYGCVILWVRQRYFPSGMGSTLLACFAAMDFLLVIPLVFSLKQRLKEIQGGEEDEARQY